MTSLYLKAVHIIFVVAWFAGLFYMPRLFVYIAETNNKSDMEKKVLLPHLTLMAERLMYIITWPAGIITLGIGVAMLINAPVWLSFGFMQIKLALVVLLYAYHLSLHVLLNKVRKNTFHYSSQQMRLWNEVATILLIAIVFLIVLKDSLTMMWGLLGLIGVMILLMIGIRIYKKFRKD
jgi:putative membrane protein